MRACARITGVVLALAVLAAVAVANDAPPPVTKVIDVGGKDPASVTAVTRSVRERAQAESRSAPLFQREAGKLVAHGAPEDVEAAEAMLKALPEAKDPEAYVVHLRHYRDANALVNVLRTAQQSLAPDVRVSVAGAAPGAEGGVDGDASVAEARARGGAAIPTLSSAETRAAILLCGPREQVIILRRWLALLDVPLPQMRFELWSLQISGGKKNDVAKRSEQAQKAIAQTRQDITEYLWLLERYAREERTRRLPVLQQSLTKRSARVQELVAQQKQAPPTIPPESGIMGVVLPPIAPQQLADAREAEQEASDEAKRIAKLLNGYRAPLAAILYLLATSGQVSADDFAAWLDKQGGEAPYADVVQRLEERMGAADKLLPSRLFTTIERLTGRDDADGDGEKDESGLRAYVAKSYQAQRGLGRPEDLAVATANAQAELAEYERALTADMHERFLAPLLVELRQLTEGRTASGLASVGATSISVLSGTAAHVLGSAMSYYDVTPEPNVDVAKLAAAFTGTPQAWLSAIEAISTPDRVWAAMSEGAQLDFLPVVLPGGGSAEITIDARVTHANPGGEVGVEKSEAPVPLSRVAEHSATTKIRLEPLDMFVLSSFGLATSHPRTDFVVPILGRIPWLGQMFRFPRSPDRVIHESLLLVYSTILPTTSDLSELLVVDREGPTAPTGTTPTTPATP